MLTCWLEVLRLLWFYECSLTVTSKRCYLAAGILVLHLLESFCLFFHGVPGALGVGVASQMYQLGLGTWYMLTLNSISQTAPPTEEAPLPFLQKLNLIFQKLKGVLGGKSPTSHHIPQIHWCLMWESPLYTVSVFCYHWLVKNLLWTHGRV